MTLEERFVAEYDEQGLSAAEEPQRDEAGRWLPGGPSPNPTGRPKGITPVRLTADLRAALPEPPTVAHRKAAAIGAGVPESEVPDFPTLQDLMRWTREIRALQGNDRDFSQIFDRVDPKPNRVDVAVGPPKRAPVPDGAPADPEREEAESFYDSLHDED